ncbi:MAG TPA: hypothetical protein VHE35_08880 [Kofleriaceae bacterium]|nr:hypothetical protein [Kofleriaceae bacterium]
MPEAGFAAFTSDATTTDLNEPPSITSTAAEVRRFVGGGKALTSLGRVYLGVGGYFRTEETTTNFGTGEPSSTDTATNYDWLFGLGYEAPSAVCVPLRLEAAFTYTVDPDWRATSTTFVASLTFFLQRKKAPPPSTTAPAP